MEDLKLANGLLLFVPWNQSQNIRGLMGVELIFVSQVIRTDLTDFASLNIFHRALSDNMLKI